jgi:outer membrane immunogenic protein
MRTRFWCSSGMLASIMAGAGAAGAADLGVKAPPNVATPVYLSDWTGFYIGVNGGYGWGDTTFDGRSWLNAKPQGGLVGGHAGYNWQYGSMVGGLEVDFDGADIKQSSVTSGVLTVPALNNQAFPLSRQFKIDELATARARLGYVILPSLLAYGTAGAAWGHSSADFSGGPVFASTNADLFGWAAGAGLEYKLVEHLLLRAEYLHYDFAKASYDRANIVPHTVNATTQVDVARAGLSYKF